MSVPILIFTVNISWGRWFVKSSLPWLIRFNAILPAIFFIFTFHFFFPPEPTNPCPTHDASSRPDTLVSGTNGTYKIALDRSNEFPPPEGGGRGGGGRWQRSRTFHSVNLPLSPRVKPFNGEFSYQPTGLRNGFSTFWIPEFRLTKGENGVTGRTDGPCV